jgi:hypothetical protein
MGQAVLGLNKDHGCGQHVGDKLGIMTRSGMEDLMFDTCLFGSFLEILRLAKGSVPGRVAYTLATSSISMMAPMAFIRLINSFLARISSGESVYRVIPPCPVSPNRLKLLIFSVILSRLHVYM